jgi:lipopolysaccharide/colanic/teichoic acid biosynthesis glycosyltransferase
MQCLAGLVPKGLETHRFDNVTKALDAIDDLHVYTIIQTELFESTDINERILVTSQEKHIAYKFIPAYGSLYTGNNEIELFHNYPVIAVHRTTLIGWGRVAKRITDLIGATIGLIITSPIFLILAIIIKATDPKGPVFYKHERVTRFGGSFNVYKLRSMYWKYSTGRGKKTEVEIFRQMGREDLIAEWEKNQKVANDPRIMPIGRFIRKTSLDELPQLWNALKGDLSLIGPRAITQAELTRYAEGSSLFLSIKPGITGLWQVSGRNNLTYEDFKK